MRHGADPIVAAGLELNIAAEKVDPLTGGFYSASDAARLLRMENARRIQGWTAGYPNGPGPAILRDYEPINGKQALSFWDLMEVRFLEHFRKQGVPLQTLRRAAEGARKEMKCRHPLALSNIRFLTDRRKVFGRVAEETGDAKTWDLVTWQYEIYDAIEEVLAKGVAFDPGSGLATSWRPLRNECPNVIATPSVAFGSPVIGSKRIPTNALFRLWRAENGDKERVAKAYRVSPAEVGEAIEFELSLNAA